MRPLFLTFATLSILGFSSSLLLAGSSDNLTPGREFRDCSQCPLMVVIASGIFMMGASASDTQQQNDEAPQHQVHIPRSLAVGKFELTRGEFAQFIIDTGMMSEDGCFQRTGRMPEKSSSLSWRNPGYPQTDDHPVVCVSWHDAHAYAAWLSGKTDEQYRLLSEAEWEYAARAGTTSERHWGSSENDGCVYANGADLTGRNRPSRLEGCPVPGWTHLYRTRRIAAAECLRPSRHAG